MSTRKRNTKQNLKIRKIKFSDLKSIKKIRRNASKTSITHYSKRDVEIMTYAGEHFLFDYLNPFRKSYVVLLKDKIVGYTEISLSKKWLWHIFINPKYFRKGIGSYVVKHVEEIFKKNNLKIINLYSRLNAVEFYKKVGFIDKGEYIWSNILTKFNKIKMRYMVKKIN